MDQNGMNHPTAPAGATQVPSDHFTYVTWVKTLVPANNQTDCVMSDVTFEPGSRNNWQTHLYWQILVLTAGLGNYQQQGQPIQLLRVGDAMTIAPNVVHWHGATPDSRFTQLAINPNISNGEAVIWQQAVTDEEYHSYQA